MEIVDHIWQPPVEDCTREEKCKTRERILALRADKMVGGMEAQAKPISGHEYGPLTCVSVRRVVENASKEWLHRSSNSSLRPSSAKL